MTAPRLHGLVVDETSGVDHPAHLREGWVVMKGATAAEVAEALGVTQEEHVTESVATETPTEVELRAQVADLTAKLAKATAPAPQPEPEPTLEDLVKSAPEPVRKALAEAEAIRKAAVARAEAAEAEVLKAAEERADAESVMKAKGWENLPLDAETFGPALRKLAAADADLAATLTTVLDAVNAQATSGELFKATGTSGAPTGAASGGTAYERLEAIAKAAIAKDASVTFEVALADAAAANADLYSEYVSERG
jgi:hypothetical protein